MTKVTFNKTDILQYKERSKLSSSKDGKIQKIQAIKTHFFAFPGKSNHFEERAQAITQLAVERIRSHTLDISAYKEELKTEIRKITHAVYQNEYMYDRERKKITEVFQTFLDSIHSTPADRLRSLQKQLEEKDPTTEANKLKIEEKRTSFQADIKNLEFQIASFDTATLGAAVKILHLRDAIESSEQLAAIADQDASREAIGHRSHEYAETARIARNDVDLLKKELEELKKVNNAKLAVEYFDEINKTIKTINNLTFQSPLQKQELRKIRLEISKLTS